MNFFLINDLFYLPKKFFNFFYQPKMNKIIFISLFLFFIFSSFTSAIPYPKYPKHHEYTKHHEYPNCPNYPNQPLSGFKPCEGTYPIITTRFSIDPYPLIPGKPSVFRYSGMSKEIIQPGAYMSAIGTLNGELLFNYKVDFCENFIETSGAKCPIEPGYVDFIYAKVIDYEPVNETVNTVVELQSKITGK